MLQVLLVVLYWSGTPMFLNKVKGAESINDELAEQPGIINKQLANPALCFLNAGYEITCRQEG